MKFIRPTHTAFTASTGLLFAAGIVLLAVMINYSVLTLRLREMENALAESEGLLRDNRNLSMLIQYDILKNRLDKPEENEETYLIEAKLKELLSQNSSSDIEMKTYIDPITYKIITGIRRLIGKSNKLGNFSRIDNKNLIAGYYYERKKQYNRAIRHYNNALEDRDLRDLKWEILLHKGFCYSLINKRDKAKEIYKKIIKENTGESEAYVASELLKKLRSVERSVNITQKSIKSKKEPLEKAWSLFNSMQYRDALKTTSRLLTKDSPSNITEALFLSGRAQEELGNIETAENTYKKLIREYPAGKWNEKANQRMLIISSFYTEDRSDFAEADKKLSETYSNNEFAENIAKIKSSSSSEGSIESQKELTDYPTKKGKSENIENTLINNEIAENKAIADTFHHILNKSIEMEEEIMKELKQEGEEYKKRRKIEDRKEREKQERDENLFNLFEEAESSILEQKEPDVSKKGFKESIKKEISSVSRQKNQLAALFAYANNNSIPETLKTVDSKPERNDTTKKDKEKPPVKKTEKSKSPSINRFSPYRVTDLHAVLRNDPDPGALIVKKLIRAETFMAESTSGKWLFARTPDGTKGWIHRDKCKNDLELGNSGIRDVKKKADKDKKRWIVVKDSTHLKEKPENGSIRATLLSGEVLTNLENNLTPSENYFHKHFKVSTNKGDTGWINSGDVVWYPTLNNDSIAKLKKEGRIIREIKRRIKEKRSKWVENYSPVMKEKRGDRAINETMSSYSQSWKRLYKKRLKQNNTISGRMKLNFAINPDGSTGDIEILYSNIEDKKLKEEVIKLIRKITFPSVPEKAGSVEIKYTLPFNKSMLVSDKEE